MSEPWKDVTVYNVHMQLNVLTLPHCIALVLGNLMGLNALANVHVHQRKYMSWLVHSEYSICILGSGWLQSFILTLNTCIFCGVLAKDMHSMWGNLFQQATYRETYSQFEPDLFQTATGGDFFTCIKVYSIKNTGTYFITYLWRHQSFVFIKHMFIFHLSINQQATHQC